MGSCARAASPHCSWYSSSAITGPTRRYWPCRTASAANPGSPWYPPGLRLRIANDPDTALQHAYGLTHEVGFAFVGSDGTIRSVIDHPASSTEISDALSTLG